MPSRPRSATGPDFGRKAPPAGWGGEAYHRAIEDAGGEKYLGATKALVGVPRAVRSNSTVTTRINAEVRLAEAAALLQFVRTEGLLFDGERFEALWREQGEMGGAENDITCDPTTGRVWKRNSIGVMHLSWRQFFERMLAHNLFFPGAPLRLEGFVESQAGLCPRFTQPDVHAVRGAQRAEIELLMHQREIDRNPYVKMADGDKWILLTSFVASPHRFRFHAPALSTLNMETRLGAAREGTLQRGCRSLRRAGFVPSRGRSANALPQRNLHRKRVIHAGHWSGFEPCF
jgi:Serine/Threonine/Tyrosine Kinase found in polyvalent proteins